MISAQGSPLRLRLFKYLSVFERAEFYLICIIACGSVLYFWAEKAMVAQVVRVDGRVIPSGKNQVIQHLEGGIVKEINVSEGQHIHKGDVLLSFDNTKAGSTLASSQIKLRAMKLKAARLRCEADHCSQPSFDKDEAGNKDAAEEEMLFNIRQQKLEQEIQTYREDLVQRNAEYEQNKTHLMRSQEELNTAEQRLKLTTNLVANKAASQLEMLDAKERVQRLVNDLDQARGNQPRVQAAIAQTESKMKEAVDRFRAEARADLSNLLPEIDRLSHEISDNSAQYSRTDLRSPVEGIINKLNYTTIGGVIRPGEAIAEITPVNDKLAIEATVHPADRGNLVVGQHAMIRITAYDTGALGVVEGRVGEISADTIADAKGQYAYRIMLYVEQLPPNYQDHPILPGMNITADIVTGQRTLISYLTSPVRKFENQVFKDSR